MILETFECMRKVRHLRYKKKEEKHGKICTQNHTKLINNNFITRPLCQTKFLKPLHCYWNCKPLHWENMVYHVHLCF
ncbi:hypothetical protein BpHYR1_008305 [Brachionus plicatilis]|uniref:Uncharacterized protein n=1 Tax=Brachionus plicatilis TaxID=10195 RepID=A0A3M7RYP2_BRAPC|nr:hypothetical protein BpHYR1_008305 [Brachionus plicatilis]